MSFVGRIDEGSDDFSQVVNPLCAGIERGRGIDGSEYSIRVQESLKLSRAQVDADDVSFIVHTIARRGDST